MSQTSASTPAESVDTVAPGPSARYAAGMLVLMTVFWGLSFPLMKNWQMAAENCPGGPVAAALTVILLRMGAALLILALVAPRLLRGPRLREHAIGMLVGFANFLGFSLQVIGLSSTTPARSGFLTSLCSAWVPVLAWLCFRMRIGVATALGLLLGLGGAACLWAGSETDWTLQGGEALTLFASLFFAIAVLLLDRLGKQAVAGHLTVGFLTATGFASLAVAVPWVAAGPGIEPWLTWTGAMLQQPAILRDFVLLTVLCTVLPFHWMMVYQPRVSAGRVALIYLLEPVFATTFSLAFGLELLTASLLLGGGLILADNLLVELPLWLREFSKRRPEPDRLSS